MNLIKHHTLRTILAAILCLLPLQTMAAVNPDLHAINYNTEFYDPNACPATTVNNNTVVLDPGHSGGDLTQTKEVDGQAGNGYHSVDIDSSGVESVDNAGAPAERQTMWDAAQAIKKTLTAAGYKVILTKTSADDNVGLLTRAKIANDVDAAIAVSLHFSAGKFGVPSDTYGVTPQKVGESRTNNDNHKSYSFPQSLSDVASNSQTYAAQIAAARTAAGDPVKVTDFTAVANFPPSRPDIDAYGNISIVQLFSKVPWVYNEDGYNGFDLKKYSDGIANGIMKAVPLNTATTQVGGGAPGSLPAAVPAPYNAIFSAAAQAAGADPALVATIFYTEHRGFPDPPPPYGKGPPWASSPAGAEGPFQFLPGTWASYSQGGNIMDLKDAAGGAARFLVALGGKNGVPFGDPANPRKVTPSIVYALAAYNAGPAGNFDNPETLQYVQIGSAIYKKLSNGAGGATDTTSDCNGGGGTGTGNSNIVAVARGQIGTKEVPDGCNCGGGIQPDGHTVDSYTQDTPEFWCADFVSWVYMKAGEPFSGGVGGPVSSQVWRIPSAAGIADYMKSHGTWIQNGPNAQPQPGMIVYFNFSHTGAIGGANDHIGIVDHVTGNTLFDIEGNAGNQVEANTYPNFRSDSTMVGFGGLNK